MAPLVVVTVMLDLTGRGTLEINGTVAIDQQAHVVDVGPGDKVIWTWELETKPECSVVDTATSEALPLEPFPRTVRRDRLAFSERIATYLFSTDSGRVTVTCSGVSRSRPARWRSGRHSARHAARLDGPVTLTSAAAVGSGLIIVSTTAVLRARRRLA